MVTYKSPILILFLIFFINLNSKIIIWDLGDTLIKNSKMEIAWQIGIGKFIKTMFCGTSPSQIQNIIFDVLDTLENQTPPVICKATHDKKYMPAIMCNWLSGIEKSQDIIYKAKKQIHKLYQNNFFKSDCEKDVIERSICAMFNPDVLAKSVRPISGARKILKDCKKSKNQMFVLSNWDPESFDQVYHDKKCNKIFKYFAPENIIISGNTGLIKPNVDIFLLFLQEYNVNPQDCIFIDDQKLNRLAAKKVGMKTIKATGDFNKIRKKLKKLGAL